LAADTLVSLDASAAITRRITALAYSRNRGLPTITGGAFILVRSVTLSAILVTWKTESVFEGKPVMAGLAVVLFRSITGFAANVADNDFFLAVILVTLGFPSGHASARSADAERIRRAGDAVRVVGANAAFAALVADAAVGRAVFTGPSLIALTVQVAKRCMLRALRAVSVGGSLASACAAGVTDSAIERAVLTTPV
jgi:hypothetical protein